MSQSVSALLDEPSAYQPESGAAIGFRVSQEAFDGPFDALLSLISARKLDITAVALAKVTDDFLAYVKTLDSTHDIGQISEFLVVAATLLDLKTARLLPQAEVDDEADLALLEARDLLIARLLHYRAVKVVAAQLAQQWAQASLSYPRAVPLEPQFAAVIPDVVGITPAVLARAATRCFTPIPVPSVSLDHLHVTPVNVADQADLLERRIRRAGTVSFRTLTVDATRMVMVARFLALLELYRQTLITFEQAHPLGELLVKWSANPDQVVDLRAIEAAQQDATVGDVVDLRHREIGLTPIEVAETAAS